MFVTWLDFCRRGETYAPGEIVPMISFWTPLIRPVETPAAVPKTATSFIFCFSSSLKNLSTSGVTDGTIPTGRDYDNDDGSVHETCFGGGGVTGGVK